MIHSTFCRRLPPQDRPRLRGSLLLSGLLALLPALLILPAWGQRVPNITGWSFNFSSGRGGQNRSTAGALSSSDGVQVVVEPGNTELIQRPDGTFAYRILDPNQKFGSALQSRTSSEQSRSNTFGISEFRDFGYSVFIP
ncbi:hypothetical protein I1E95_09845 [Synechococcus sp. CBW1107]|jgi:hypothetical protein|uniref:hypothetical protein n=1 Tax=Synechococcus sp. CBW1107 TaxID=2789857 RepID=UPI0018CD388F|nr:hypothetical protein [Synechococcus sp. CBW1107]QPN55516.1 hypothetical protein I1E95_09845 [Synechococcus sp. CBW1107]